MIPKRTIQISSPVKLPPRRLIACVGSGAIPSPVARTGGVSISSSKIEDTIKSNHPAKRNEGPSKADAAGNVVTREGSEALSLKTRLDAPRVVPCVSTATAKSCSAVGNAMLDDYSLPAGMVRRKVGERLHYSGREYVVEMVNECRARCKPVSKLKVAFGESVAFEASMATINISPSREINERTLQ